MSFRKQQIESLLKRAVSQVLTQKLSDPRVTGMISVTRVDVSPDLHNAFVYLTILPEKAEKTTLHGLKHAVGHIYNAVCKLVAIKTVPKLEFRLDKAVKKEAAVLGAIRRGLAQEKQREPAPSDAARDDDASPDPSPEDPAP